MPATISLVSTIQSDTFATNNTTATLVPSTLGNCMFVITRVKSTTVTIVSMSGGGCAEWDMVGSYAFTTGAGAPASENVQFWVGRVTTTGSQTLTLTGSSSLASISGSTLWQQFTTSGVGAGTSWVAELGGASLINGTSTNITYPTLVPVDVSRCYIGYGISNTTPNTTGATAGYTAQVDTNTTTNKRGQLLTNPNVSTSQSPTGTQTSGTSAAAGIMLYATNADTAVATTLNISAASGKNHFKLQTAFAGYGDIVEVLESDVVLGWNTSPQFMTVTDSYGRPGVQFMVNVAAPTTDGSSFPRTELRELDTDGVTLYGFNPQSGTHYLRGRTKITNLTVTKPTVIFGQCHNASSDIIALCSQLNSGTGLVNLLIRINGTASSIPKMSSNYTVGDEFDWMIQFTSSGYWAVYYHDMNTPFYDSVAHAALGLTGITYTGSADCYFKAGCYSNTNTASELGDATQFMRLELRYLSHWHTGWPTADPVVLPPPPIVPVVQSTPLAPRLRSSNW